MPKSKLRSPGHSCPILLGIAVLLSSFADLRAQSEASVIASQAGKAMQEERFAEAAELYGRLADSYPGEPSLLANLGMALHLSGQDTNAILPLRSAASAMPSSFPAHFFLGASYSRLGNFAEAVDPLRQSVRLNPEHPFARALLGDALEALGEYSRSVRQLEEAPATRRRQPVPSRRLGAQLRAPVLRGDHGVARERPGVRAHAAACWPTRAWPRNSFRVPSTCSGRR